jgi:hypothetical protein
MGNLHQAYEELALFIASLDPQKLLDLKPSEATLERVEELIFKKKEAALDEAEQRELDRYLALEHLIALAKAQARIRLMAA